MSEAFYDVASIDYPIIDADAHVNEPPDLWETRVPHKWRERAPRVDHAKEGDIWVFDAGKETWPVALTAAAGKSPLEFSPFGERYETMRPGSFDPKSRLQDMDADGIYCQVIYPSVTLRGAKTYGSEPELQRVCVRAYNAWLAEFCAASAGRLIGQAIIPATGVQDALVELEWSLKNGHRGAILSCFPNGSLSPRPEDDRFWGLAQEAGVPVAVHTGSFMREELKAESDEWWTSFAMISKGAKMTSGSESIPVACDLLFSRVPERFPRIKFVLVESNIGWIPTLLEQTDHIFRRLRWMMGVATEMKAMPSEIFRRNFWATFIIDSVGVELRHRMNVNRLMWSSDYPHSVSSWPDSADVIERQFRGVPSSEVKKILHTNCKELYQLDVPAVKVTG